MAELEHILTLLLQHGGLDILDVKNLCAVSLVIKQTCWSFLNSDRGRQSHRLLQQAVLAQKGLPRDVQPAPAVEQAMVWLLQSLDKEHNLFWRGNPHKAETIKGLLRAPGLSDNSIQAFIQAGVRLSDSMVLDAIMIPANAVDAEQMSAARKQVVTVKKWVERYHDMEVPSGLSYLMDAVCAGEDRLDPQVAYPDGTI